VNDEKDIAQERLAALRLQLGIYRHYRGGLYCVFAVSLDEDTLAPLVHYYSYEKKTRWTRTLVNFHGYLGPGEFSGQRFTFVREFREPGDIDPAIVVPWK
jgi:hypothetical protein